MTKKLFMQFLTRVFFVFFSIIFLHRRVMIWVSFQKVCFSIFLCSFKINWASTVDVNGSFLFVVVIVFSFKKATKWQTKKGQFRVGRTSPSQTTLTSKLSSLCHCMEQLEETAYIKSGLPNLNLNQSSVLKKLEIL